MTSRIAPPAAGSKAIGSIQPHAWDSPTGLIEVGHPLSLVKVARSLSRLVRGTIAPRPSAAKWLCWPSLGPIPDDRTRYIPVRRWRYRRLLGNHSQWVVRVCVHTAQSMAPRPGDNILSLWRIPRHGMRERGSFYIYRVAGLSLRKHFHTCLSRRLPIVSLDDCPSAAVSGVMEMTEHILRCSIGLIPGSSVSKADVGTIYDIT